MTIDTNWFVDKFKQVFTPDRINTPPQEADKTINNIAPDRIKRSPGHQNIAELADEPEWYHD